MTANWTNPDACPFCEDELPDPGAGFVDHLDTNPDCEDRFDVWRENVAGDVTAEWAG